MTRDEREKRWQELFDRYDRAVADFGRHQTSLRDALAPQLNRLIATLDESVGHVNRLITTMDDSVAASRRMMEATLEANRTALSLYRDEREDPTV